MKITERKLRSIIRSVIKESLDDMPYPEYPEEANYDLDAYDRYQDDLAAYDAQQVDNSRLPKHDTYMRDEDLCDKYNVPCTSNNVEIIKKAEQMGLDPRSQLARRGDL
jgi:hypothetical protein